MACVVCQHCQHQVCMDEVAMQEGFSYHKKCHKCYVCSETNLRNAEVFKGVIFCCSCSQRIFQGCSTARKTKDGTRGKGVKGKKRRERREKVRAQERRTESSKTRPVKGVLELARLTASTESESSNYREKNRSRQNNALALSTELELHIGKEIYEDHSKDLKKMSNEMGITTEVTQELLKQMNCPVISDRKKGYKTPQAVSPPKEKGDSRYNKTIICSDLRIAELGASTEIAHMALRKQSEMPIIIKSDSVVKASVSPSVSALNQESDVSGDDNEDWLDSSYSLKHQEKNRWLDRRIGSILKMPYKSFKKNILDRSSLITVLMSSEHSSHFIVRRLRRLFHEEIVEHQHRGIQRLYSTINRKKIPCKLGWLNLMSKMSSIIRPDITNRQRIEQPKRCKHFKRSHSYRCMRAQVMKLAGPTKSELAFLRQRIKTMFLPRFIKRIIMFNKKYPAIMTSQACGSDVKPGALRNAKSN